MFALPTCIGIVRSEISKILMPLNLSGVGSEPAPCKPQSTLPLVSCTDMINKFSTIETSP